MTLSQSQLRFLSSLGIGILVGTSLVVIIPEGIEAVAKTGLGAHEHGTRHVIRGGIETRGDGLDALNTRAYPPACDKLRRSPRPEVSITTRQDNKVDSRDLLDCIESVGIPGNVNLHPRDNACDKVVRSMFTNTASDKATFDTRASDGCVEPTDARHKPSACDPWAKRDLGFRECLEAIGDVLNGVQVHAIAPVCDKLIRDTVLPAREAMSEARGCVEAVDDAEIGVKTRDMPPACDKKIRAAFLTGSEADILEARGCFEGRTMPTGVEARNLPPACDKKIRTALTSRSEADMEQARACIEKRDLPPVCDKKIRTALATGLDNDVLVARGCIEPVKSRDSPPAFDRGLRIRAKGAGNNQRAEPEKPKDVSNPSHSEAELPTFFIGFSLMTGFVLMFLIDRLPRHATENLQSAPATRHISLDNLETSSVRGDDESEGFLGSLTPSRRQTKGFATTVGLVIHATADGIAMGASAVTEDMKLGFIIFLAIMIHKAPAAFGLTSVLLKQGLSKRAARVHLVAFSVAAPVGALTTYLAVSAVGGSGMQGEAGQWWTGMLLLFSGGTFL